MMPTYWLVKALLLLALIGLVFFTLRPIRSARHLALRRLGVLAVIVFAAFAVFFPGLLNRAAWILGVERGVNLLLYVITVAFFMQIASSYRRDVASERRLTRLARALALSHVQYPQHDEDLR